MNKWWIWGSKPSLDSKSGGDREKGQAYTLLSCQGTTGSPKGVTLSHYNIVNNSNMIGKRLNMHLKVRSSAAWGRAY